jgi:hypothetical protein
MYFSYIWDLLQEIIQELGAGKETVQRNHPITHCNKMSQHAETKAAHEARS